MKSNNSFIKIIGAVFVLITTSFAAGIGINNSQYIASETNTVLEIGNIDETTIDLTVNPGEYKFDIVATQEGMFATITLPNFGFAFVKGEAKLPIIRKIVEIPHGSNPEVFISSISWEYTSLNELHLPNRIIPAQQSVEKIPEALKDFVIDEEYYSTSSFVPEKFAGITEIGKIRSRRFALVEISPIQYKPLTGELKIMDSCEIKINLPNSNMALTYEKIHRYSSPSFEKMFEIVFANYGFYEYELKNRDQEGYLIIVYDNFYDEIQPLSDLKQTFGYDVTVTKTSDIPGGTTKEKIYDYIEDAYNTWNIPPSYVLLVGDTPQIPTFTGSSSFSEADLYYVTVDGSDYFPDIHIGRFPASEEAHVEAMVEKTVYYEEGIFENDSWIKKAAFIASTDNYWISEGTHNYVIDTYLNPNGYTCDKLYSYTFGANTQDVHDAINDGRSLVIFSGHGGPNGWGDGPPFYKSDVKDLMNEDMYPFVGSHACSTNTFNDPECFGETWLREADKAGLAFWGASASTYWDEDDILEKAMFQAWWDDGLEWIGSMTDMALLYLFENYSGGGYTQYYFEAYNVNGDPSVKIWSGDPNSPPETPDKLNGPTQGCENEELTFTTSTTDPDEDQVYYKFDWGEGTESNWLGPFNSGETIQASNKWDEIGDYEIKVKAKDIKYGQSGWSEPHNITIIENLPPENPSIKCSRVGRVGKPFQVTLTTTDPEGHDVYYYINWGDGIREYWLGPYTSGEEATLTHIYNQSGTITIITKSRDTSEKTSGQTNFKIFIIKDRAVTNSVFLRIIENFINQFPFIAWLIEIVY